MAGTLSHGVAGVNSRAGRRIKLSAGSNRLDGTQGAFMSG